MIDFDFQELSSEQVYKKIVDGEMPLSVFFKYMDYARRKDAEWNDGRKSASILSQSRQPLLAEN